MVPWTPTTEGHMFSPIKSDNHARIIGAVLLGAVMGALGFVVSLTVMRIAARRFGFHGILVYIGNWYVVSSSPMSGRIGLIHSV